MPFCNLRNILERDFGEGKATMILEPKQTNIAYRCPRCGSGVISAVGIFSLSADMVKLKCTCGESEMTILYGKDGKIRITVPCLVCPNPHQFTLTSNVFFKQELFSLPCPYTGINLAVLGELNRVKAELARSELELLDLMEKSGVTDFSAVHEAEKEALSDHQIDDIILYVIKELDEEGKIFCKCKEKEPGREFDVEMREDGILVTCKRCGASRLIPTDSRLGAYAFLNADSLHLE